MSSRFWLGSLLTTLLFSTQVNAAEAFDMACEGTLEKYTLSFADYDAETRSFHTMTLQIEGKPALKILKLQNGEIFVEDDSVISVEQSGERFRYLWSRSNGRMTFGYCQLKEVPGGS